jgi:hypothetical protein
MPKSTRVYLIAVFLVILLLACMPATNAELDESASGAQGAFLLETASSAEWLKGKAVDSPEKQAEKAAAAAALAQAMERMANKAAAYESSIAAQKQEGDDDDEDAKLIETEASEFELESCTTGCDSD